MSSSGLINLKFPAAVSQSAVRMSRIRTTLDSVTKAVGSTDLISKFSRLKPGGSAVDSSHAEKVLVKAETLTSSNSASPPPPEGTMKEEEEGERNTAEEESEKQLHKVAENPFVVAKKSQSTLASVANVSGSSSSSTVAKQTMQLFHPAALSTNMDETYKTLAQHINNYFGTNTQVEDTENRPLQQHRGGDDPVSEPGPHLVPQRTRDHIPILSPVAEAKNIEAPSTSPVPSSPSEKISPPVGTPSNETPTTENTDKSTPVPATSTKKGFTHYLSYPRPSVQAFVGSYIAPLVPKFRGDSKSISAEKDKVSAVAGEDLTADKAGEKTDSEEEKADKVKQQQQLAQRQKVRCLKKKQRRVNTEVK